MENFRIVRGWLGGLALQASKNSTRLSMTYAKTCHPDGVMLRGICGNVPNINGHRFALNTGDLKTKRVGARLDLL